MANLARRILSYAKSRGKGWVFTPKHLLALSNRAAIDQSLHRLVQQGLIRRIARGIYDIPVVHPTFGPLSPTADAIAKAVADASGYTLQVSPARAANLLGLSTQVPAKLVYLTDGSSRQLKVGNQVLQLRHASRRPCWSWPVRRVSLPSSRFRRWPNGDDRLGLRPPTRILMLPSRRI